MATKPGQAILPWIPGSDPHHQAEIRGLENVVGQENRQHLEQAQADEAQARGKSLDVGKLGPLGHTIETANGIKQWNPQTQRYDIDAGDILPKEETEGKTVTTDQGVMQWDPKTKKYDITVGGAPGAKTAEVRQGEDGTFYSVHPDGTAEPITVKGKPLVGKSAKEPLEDRIVAEHQAANPGETLADARKATAVNPPKPPEPPGTWELQEDAQGKPILFNTKTSETKPAPAGMQKTGTTAKANSEREKIEEPIRAAQEYATDYVQHGAFTGPGDEALQEKFFELAKPSTGFRMTQPQMNMLMQSRAWKDSAEAFARHALTGKWFSDEQRRQIVGTMNDLAKAKLESFKSSPGAGTQGDPLGIR